MSILTEVLDEVKRQSVNFSSKKELQNKSWLRYNEDGLLIEKVLLRFLAKGQLMVSVNGQVHDGTWELLDENLILIGEANSKTLYRVLKYKEGILLLNQDGTDVVLTLVEENLLKQIGKSIYQYFTDIKEKEEKQKREEWEKQKQRKKEKEQKKTEVNVPKEEKKVDNIKRMPRFLNETSTWLFTILSSVIVMLFLSINSENEQTLEYILGGLLSFTIVLFGIPILTSIVIGRGRVNNISFQILTTITFTFSLLSLSGNTSIEVDKLFQFLTGDKKVEESITYLKYGLTYDEVRNLLGSPDNKYLGEGYVDWQYFHNIKEYSHKIEFVRFREGRAIYWEYKMN